MLFNPWYTSYFLRQKAVFFLQLNSFDNRWSFVCDQLKPVWIFFILRLQFVTCARAGKGRIWKTCTREESCWARTRSSHVPLIQHGTSRWIKIKMTEHFHLGTITVSLTGKLCINVFKSKTSHYWANTYDVLNYFCSCLGTSNLKRTIKASISKTKLESTRQWFKPPPL